MPWKKGNRLPLVQEDEASPQVAEIFDEIKAALGIGFVPLCFRAYACYPKFLEAQWHAMRPLLATREFFDLAARLRAEAYTYVHNYFKVPAQGEGLTVSQAAPVVDLLYRVDSAALLLLSLQLQAFEGPIGRLTASHPANRAAIAPSPEFVAIEAASAPVRRAFEELRHALDLPFVTDEQRALAQWPELFFAFWQAFRPAIQSVFHEQAIFRIRESAWTCTQEIPVQIDMEYSDLLEDGVDADEIATLTRLTELLVRGAAASLLNETFAKIGLEGGNQAARAPQSAEERVA